MHLFNIHLSLGLLMLTCYPAQNVMSGETPLSESGKALQAKYADQKKSLQKAIRGVDAQTIKAYERAKAKERTAEANIGKVSKKLGRGRHYESAIAYRREVVRNMDKKIMAEKEKIEGASDASVREMAKKDTQELLQQAKIDQCIGNGDLDSQLTHYVILRDITPRELAEFSQKGKKEAALIDRLFSNRSLMRQMPFTCCKWRETEPVTISLKQGQNTLRLWRLNPPQKGVAVKFYKLRSVQ